MKHVGGIGPRGGLALSGTRHLSVPFRNPRKPDFWALRDGGRSLWASGIYGGPPASFSILTERAYVDRDGILRWAPANTPSSMYAGGYDWFWFHPQQTNRCLQSNAFTTSPWTTTGTLNRTQNVTGPDAVVNSAWTVEDADSEAAAGLVQSGMAITANNNPVVAYVIIRKDTDETRFPALKLELTGGTAVTALAQINTATGQTGQTGTWNPTAHGSVEIIPGWWVFYVVATNNNTNTGATVTLYPARASTLTGGETAGLTGSVVLYHVQVVRDASGWSMPIKTTTAAASGEMTNLAYPRFVNPRNHAVSLEVYPLQGTTAEYGFWRLVTFNDPSGANYIGRTYGGVAWGFATQTSGGYVITLKAADFRMNARNVLKWWVFQQNSSYMGWVVRCVIWLNGNLVYDNAPGALAVGAMRGTTQIGGYSTTGFFGGIRNVKIKNNPTRGYFRQMDLAV